ncbi:MAG: GNAT family N-acetyltransferase [Betaproteobacteria bacterium]
MGSSDLLVRAASTADGGMLAELAHASGLGEHDSGADPLYVEHLLTHGRLIIAEDRNNDPIGYAAAITIGDRLMLTDLFVRPDRQGAGAGRALLDEVLPCSTYPMTFSSHDPRAVTLYSRRGMSATWVLLYLRGDPAALSPPLGWRVGTVPAETAAVLERSITGLDRSAVYGFWASRPRGAAVVVVNASDREVAAGAVGGGGDEYGVSHLSCRSTAEAADATVAVLAQLTGPARVCLPATHPAVGPLIAHGFVVADFDLFMTTRPGEPAPPAALSPALY